MRPEAVVMAQILEKWGAHADFHIRRNNSGALFDRNGRLVRFGLPGSGDIEGLVNPRGRFLSVECKTSVGEQKALQQNYQAMIERRGGIYIVARSLAHFDVEITAILEREHAMARRLAEVLA